MSEHSSMPEHSSSDPPPRRVDPLPPDTGTDEPSLAEATPDTLPVPAEHAEALMRQADEDRDDGALQEWIEDQVLRGLPLERYVDPETEEEFVELLADVLAAKGADLVEFLWRRLVSSEHR